MPDVHLAIYATESQAAPWAVDSRYVETYYRPAAGPSVLGLVRLVRQQVPDGETLTVDLAELAAALGLGHRGAHSRLLPTLARAEFLTMASWDPDRHHFAVRSHLPWLSSKHLAKLPQFLVHQHAALRNSALSTGAARP